MIFLKFHVDPM